MGPLLSLFLLEAFLGSNADIKSGPLTMGPLLSPFLLEAFLCSNADIK